MQIAIFGGSFDPPHIAHERIVKKALECLDIQKLFVVPTYLNPFKSNFHFDPQTRFNLVKKVFFNVEKVEVSSYEIDKEEKVPSYETVMYFKNKFKPNKIYLIIGSDNLKSLEKWYKYDELKKEVEFIVAKRVGFLNEKLDNIRTFNVDIDISSTHLRKNIEIEFIPKSIKDDILKYQNNKKEN